MEEAPKCFNCELKLQGKPMTEIGGIGKTLHWHNKNEDGSGYGGVTEIKLWQCPTCKEVKLCPHIIN